MTACSSIPSGEERYQIALHLASEKGWQASRLASSPFQLMTFSPPSIKPSNNITIYIEGDGFAWVSRSQISLNPTPIKPLALSLAMAQPKGVAIYLARPCQYVWQENLCEKKYWTTGRFSLSILDSLDHALSLLKQQYQAKSITLVGYSGGASLAALLAAKRDDIVKLVTIAGNLDHAAWTAAHQLTPLSDSLNSVDQIQRLQNIQQIHFVGEKDSNIPPYLVSDFVARYHTKDLSKVMVIDDFSHICCWVEQWATLWQNTQ